MPEGIDPTFPVNRFIQAVLGQETGRMGVADRVVDVNGLMADIEIATNDQVRRFRSLTRNPSKRSSQSILNDFTAPRRLYLMA